MKQWIVDHSKPTLEQMLRTPFYVVSETENTLKWKSVNGVKINWSLNEDLTDYHELPANTTTEVSMPAGKKVYLFCTEDQPAFSSCKLDCQTNFNVGGNICFLSEVSCYKKTNFQPACRNAFQFSSLFKDSTIVDSSSMCIGFSEQADGLCERMFQDCTSLVNAPQLPSKVAYPNCYTTMFSG